MAEQSIPTTYFEEPGPHNTQRALELAQRRISELSLGHAVVASDTGKTARAAIEVFGPGVDIVVVTNPAGLRFPVAKLHDYLPRFKDHKEELLSRGIQHVPCSLTGQEMESLKDRGAKAVTRLDWKTLHAFTRKDLSAIDRVGVAVRVGVTITAWATKCGAVPPDKDVLAIAGTGFGGGGADTAVVVRTGSRFSDFRVLEIVAKPRVSPPSELPA